MGASLLHNMVCCSVLQCVAVCCSVLQCMLYIKMDASLLHNMVCCSVLQCVAVHVVHQDGRISVAQHGYGVATIGKLLDIIGLFCKRAL